MPFTPNRNRPRTGDRSKAADKQQLTMCKICPHGVYSDQPWKFYTRPVLGISHTACVEALEA